MLTLCTVPGRRMCHHGNDIIEKEHSSVSLILNDGAVKKWSEAVSDEIKEIATTHKRHQVKRGT